MERGEAPVVRGRGGEPDLTMQNLVRKYPKNDNGFSGCKIWYTKSDNVKSGKKQLGVSNSEAKIKPGLDNPGFL